jgi:hypothetical protein
MLGCPKLDESDWCRLGSAKYGHEGMQLPAKEWPCFDCEFLISGIDDIRLFLNLSTLSINSA